jgi:hypothetical protein
MGDIVDALRKEGHIRDRPYAAVARLIEDMRRAHGSSKLGSVMLTERVQGSVRPLFWPQGGGDLDAFHRMDAVLSRLDRHEREVMAYMIRARELPRGSLSERGRQLSGYEHGRSARAYMTGRICALLDSIAEGYPV